MRTLGRLVDGRRHVFAENALPDAASDRRSQRKAPRRRLRRSIEPFYRRVATEHHDVGWAVPVSLCPESAPTCRPREHPRGCRESDLLGNRVDLHVDPAVHRPIRSVVPIAQYDGRALSRNVGVYRDIFHGMRYTPAPMIDFIDGDEQSDFLRQEEVCGLDIARQDQRSWN